VIGPPVTTAASATSTAVRAPAWQAGAFAGLNATIYNSDDPIIMFIIIQATIVIALTRRLY